VDTNESHAAALHLFRAARLLALGSSILLIWSILSFTGGGIGWTSSFALPIFVGIALPIHFIGWINLNRASRKNRAMTLLFRSSLVAFGIGLASLAIASLPPLPGFWAYVPSMFLLSGGFAFIPTVYGPVVLAHALLFLIGSRFLRDVRAFVFVNAGGGFLIFIVTIAILMQASQWFNQPVPIITLAGVTSFGYLMVGIGLKRASEAGSRPVSAPSAIPER